MCYNKLNVTTSPVLHTRCYICYRLMRRFLNLFFAGGIFLKLGVIQAQLINVDFNQNNGVGFGGGGPNPGPTMSGAAVLGAAGDKWNAIDVSSGTNITLNDANGNASPVTL